MEGKMGAVPDWYPLFIAADRCHCPPWELLKQSIYWRDRALIANTAEHEAQEILNSRK